MWKESIQLRIDPGTILNLNSIKAYKYWVSIYPEATVESYKIQAF